MKFADFVHLRGLTAVAAYLGLGTIATQNANAVAITGGTATFTGKVISSLSGLTSLGFAFQFFDSGFTVGDPTDFTDNNYGYFSAGGADGGMSWGGQANQILTPQANLWFSSPFSFDCQFTGATAGVPQQPAFSINARNGGGAGIGMPATAVLFGVFNDFGPQIVSVVEKYAGFIDSIGALGINCQDAPGAGSDVYFLPTVSALLHIRNRVPNSGTNATTRAFPVSRFEGVSDQTGDLTQWLLAGGSVLSGVKPTGALYVPDEVYGSGWNGSLEVPTKNAVYDKIQTLGSAAYTASTAYDAAGAAAGLLSSANPWIGVNTFGTIGGAVGKLVLAGSTSGSSILNAAAVAGTTTITLPGVTSTLATLAANTFTGVQTLPAGTSGAPSLNWGVANVGFYKHASYANSIVFQGSGTDSLLMGQANLQFPSNGTLSWSNQVNTFSGSTEDTFLKKNAPAILQQGLNGASPVAQRLLSAGARAGTDSNVGGADFAHGPGLGTGTGTPASYIVKAPAVVASGTGAQTDTEIFRANTTSGLKVASGQPLQLGNAAVTGLAAGVLAATTNATVTITDSAGQVYRVPCII